MKGKGWKQAMHKSHKCYISRIHGGRTPGAISMKFGPLVHMAIVISFAKFYRCSFSGLNLAMV
jgi:hypothetical protein